MYVVLFFIALGLSSFITDKSNDVESNSEFLQWSKKDIAIIGIAFAAGVLLQTLSTLLIPKLSNIFALGIYGIAVVLALIYANKSREKTIIEHKKQIGQIFEAVGKMTGVKEIDYNDLPFEITKESGKVNEIKVEMKEPSKFNDGACTNAVYSLNRYFPYYEWQYSVKYQEQVAIFKGQKLPPKIAKWPGSDLRGPRFIPVGVNGDSEVGLNLGEKNFGESMFMFEDGSSAKTSPMPSAPHTLTVGSTGGGKAIWVDQEIW